MSAEKAVRHWFDAAQLAPLGAGHIHDTYLVATDTSRYVMQRVNQAVFTQPELMMEQTQRLLLHWGRQAVYAVPQLVPASEGAPGIWVDGEYWRMWTYIVDTTVVDPIEQPAQARQAGTAFAALQVAMRNLPGAPFADPIEGFMQLEHYLRAYDRVEGQAPGEHRALVRRYRSLAAVLSRRNAVIHGDCKINNLLFDDTGRKVAAIIDFDTAMHGHWAWDFGDLVRSVCYSGGEDYVEYFSACLEGFAAHQTLCTVEESVAAPGYVSLMLGVRFLTDHLNGDRYFTVERRGDNLKRAEEQFALFEGLLAHNDRLRDAAEEILGRAKAAPGAPR